MKNRILLLLAAVLLTAATPATAQVNLFNAGPETQHLLSLHVGWDYATTWGIGYAYRPSGQLPVFLKADFSIPSGSNLDDDFKILMGAQVRWLQRGHFMFSTELDGIFRRYQNDYARLLDFGCYVSGVAGYYSPHWFIAGEAAFDKAIATHFKHSEAMKETYPSIFNGWAEPATGGNFSFGMQGGVSFGQNEVNLKAGRVVEQSLEGGPLIPYYLQLTYNRRIAR
jgi:hypothetical protein